MDDSATDLGGAGFGLMFYNARWYDPVLGRFAQADSIIPGGMQGLDRYAYVSNSPGNYIDPSGHKECDPESGCDPSTDNENTDNVDDPVELSADSQLLLYFSKKFGIGIDKIIIAGLASEAAGWANDNDVMNYKASAWGNHYKWYVRHGCNGFDTPNCKLNFYMDYSESIIKLVNKNMHSTTKKISLVTNPSYYRNEYADNWAAGQLLYDSVQSSSSWELYDPDHNPADRNLPFDVGILPLSYKSPPVIGFEYNQFVHFSRVIYKEKKSLSVIMTYCQDYWRSNGVVLDGC